MLEVHAYNNIGAGPSFIKEVEHLAHNALANDREYFCGACCKCGALASEIRLQRCAGCQLVSYCNKNCQHADWKQHKILCKTFPVENGKNVIVRKIESVRIDSNYDCGSFAIAMNELVNLALKICEQYQIYTNSYVKDLFQNSRVCGACHEARQEMLFNCRCFAVSYCSVTHCMLDVEHKTKECDLLYHCAMANRYLAQHHQLNIPDGLLDEANLNDGLKFGKVSKLAEYSSEKWLETIVNLINGRLSFPLTIYFVLQKIMHGDQRKISEINHLTIHIVHSNPMLDPRIWEFFLHQLPNLKILNLIFINGNINLVNNYNDCLPVERCSDCNRNERVITYDIRPLHYHEYCSSDAYVQPNIVAVFGSFTELTVALKNIDEAHSFTSQSMNSKHTIVILTDFLRVHLEECMERFHDARPVNVLLPVQENPVCGFSTFRAHHAICNIMKHVCCLVGE